MFSSSPPECKARSKGSQRWRNPASTRRACLRILAAAAEDRFQTVLYCGNRGAAGADDVRGSHHHHQGRVVVDGGVVDGTGSDLGSGQATYNCACILAIKLGNKGLGEDQVS